MQQSKREQDDDEEEMNRIFEDDSEDEDEFKQANELAAAKAQEQVQEQQQQQQHPQAQQLLKQLFGGDSDDSDLDDLGQVKHVDFDDLSDEDDDDNALPLPSFRKKSAEDDDGEYDASESKKLTKKRSRSRKSDGIAASERPAAPEKVKSEAQEDIDSILQRLKPVRSMRATDLQNEVEVDDMITRLCNHMRDAAVNDRKFNKDGMPAIAKLKLLPTVMLELSKSHWYNQLLESNVLECVRYWLDPLDDGSLPSLDIQQSMLTSVLKMPIETHHLRVSRLGRVVRFYTKCDRVSPSIQKLANELVRKWMRPILGKSDDLKHRKLKEARYESAGARKVVMAGRGQFERENMAAIPQKVAADFSIVPVSSFMSAGGSVGLAGDGKKSDKFRKMKALMKRK